LCGDNGKSPKGEPRGRGESPQGKRCPVASVPHDVTNPRKTSVLLQSICFTEWKRKHYRDTISQKNGTLKSYCTTKAAGHMDKLQKKAQKHEKLIIYLKHTAFDDAWNFQ